MKRLHVHVAVGDLAASVRFYSTLFDAAPAVLKPDYAKWMLDDPRVNFAISERGVKRGLDHLGIQVESAAELAEIADRLGAAAHPVERQQATACCYARSDKAWVNDPQGVAWETFFTFGESTTYGEDLRTEPPKEPCCPGDTASEPARSSTACCSRAES